MTDMNNTFGTIYAISVILIGIFTLICWWRIYAKAGEKGWKILIPLYNNYIKFKIAWKPRTYFIQLTLCILLCVSYFMYIHSIIGFAYDSEVGLALYLYAGIANLVISIAIITIWIILSVKIAKAFGKDGGFAAGLIFLTPIFLGILAFGSAKYIGTSDMLEKKADDEVAALYASSKNDLWK